MKQLPFSVKVLFTISVALMLTAAIVLIAWITELKNGSTDKPAVVVNAAENTTESIGIMKPIEREGVVDRLYYDANTEVIYVYMETEGVYDHSSALSPYYAYNGEILHYCPHDDYFYVFTDENERLQVNLFSKCD